MSKHYPGDRLQFTVLCDRKITGRALSFNPNDFFSRHGKKGFHTVLSQKDYRICQRCVALHKKKIEVMCRFFQSLWNKSQQGGLLDQCHWQKLATWSIKRAFIFLRGKHTGKIFLPSASGFCYTYFKRKIELSGFMIASRMVSISNNLKAHVW